MNNPFTTNNFSSKSINNTFNNSQNINLSNKNPFKQNWFNCEKTDEKNPFNFNTNNNNITNTNENNTSFKF